MSGQPDDPFGAEVISHVHRDVVDQNRDRARLGDAVVVRAQRVGRELAPEVAGRDHEGRLGPFRRRRSSPLDGGPRRFAAGPGNQTQRRRQGLAHPADVPQPLGLGQVSRLTIRSQRDHAVQRAITEVLEKAGRRGPQRRVRREGGRDRGEDPGKPGNAHLAILWTAGAHA